VPDFRPTNFINNAYRAIDGLLEHEILINDLHHCECRHPKTSIMNIYPDKLVIDTLEFNHDKIRAGYAQGYEHGKRLLEKGSM
jgi:predicted patatin/cPLA2 family phospholipase